MSLSALPSALPSALLIVPAETSELSSLCRRSRGEENCWMVAEEIEVTLVSI
jgi:hypothetical protein